MSLLRCLILYPFPYGMWSTTHSLARSFARRKDETTAGCALFPAATSSARRKDETTASCARCFRQRRPQRALGWAAQRMRLRGKHLLTAGRRGWTRASRRARGRASPRHDKVRTHAHCPGGKDGSRHCNKHVFRLHGGRHGRTPGRRTGEDRMKLRDEHGHTSGRRGRTWASQRERVRG